MSNGTLGPLHPAATQRSGYQYFFYTKHHRSGKSPYAQWDPGLTKDEEFAVFDLADLHDLADQNGHLFGVHIGPGKKPLELGTRGEFVAEFRFTAPGHAWHGYPLFPIAKHGQDRKRRTPIPRATLDKMVAAGLLKRAHASQLKKGKAP
jgi:hypothetical protein